MPFSYNNICHNIPDRRYVMRVISLLSIAIAGLFLSGCAGTGTYPNYYYNQYSNYNSAPKTQQRVAVAPNSRYASSYGSTTQKIGNFYYHSNGSVTQRIGNFYYNSDGTTIQKIGNIYYGSNGNTVQKIGNFYYGSDGSTTQKIGNFYYHSDGTMTQKIGNMYYTY